MPPFPLLFQEGVGAEWCPYFEALESTVFTRPDFIEQSRQVVAVSLDGDQPDAQQWGQTFKVVVPPRLSRA